ncbi:Nif3-like dinuclear metal center hexameric protein [Vagococcus entomophilus]|uniref:GTP cyclohydrolase 1 type 2 homolog n=1 Tax=Vagococcus entomophilus TaxID=1160095 RepID=A0A430AIX0_9ENTE|nr:Nif3-like dinuclear metal center hexameric protein [Vagococcus entomophilus]RSU08035.1 Nif3-like dinuclear metal center hexameric protein [Vagococcus entomophilus]
MSISGIDFIKKFETYCPIELAEKGDPVGLHIGSLKKPVQRIMMTLDVRPEVVQEAIDKNIDLLIAKHPPIFRAIQRLTSDNPQTAMYLELAKHDIAVYAAHTNMDIIDNGLNDWFCERLEIENTTYMKKTHELHMKKLEVYVPKEYAKNFREALSKIGVGQIGPNYKDCSYSVAGLGRFTPINHAHPTIGELNQAECVEEEKIEVLFLETKLNAIMHVLNEAHPYEEPAYTLTTIENFKKPYGIGRVGNLAKPLKLSQFIDKVKEAFQIEGLRVITQSPNQRIQRVAICGGSGEKFYLDALRHQADVYITGDVYYHTAHDMLSSGLTVLDPGHYIETLCKKKFVELFETWKKEEKWDVEFFCSSVNTNPFQWV